MEVKVFSNTDELNKYCEQMFIDIMTNNDAPTLGLATGSSPVGVYQELIKANQEGIIDFSNTTTFNLDEYCGIDRNHEQSYWTFMHQNLFNHVNINENNINLPEASGDLDQACSEYNNKLNNANIDIQILGIGSNGHIAFNEPGTSFESTVHKVELDEKTRQDNARFFKSIDEVPTHAITMGLSNIMQAKKIVLIATGENKADAIKGMIEGEKTTSLPASILQDHPDVTILLDEEAASKLSK